MNIIALVHDDVHSKETLHNLSYCFSCHLKPTNNENKLRCIGRLKSSGGKIIDSVSRQLIGNSFNTQVGLMILKSILTG